MAPAPMPAGFDAQTYQGAMSAQGFAVIPGFLEGAHCERLKALLEQAVADYMPVPGSERSALDRYLMHDLLARDLAFAQLLDDPRLQSVMAPLLGEHWVCYAFTSSSIPPGGTNYGRRIHVDSPRHIPDYPTNIGLIWALDAFTDENGGTEVLPGSHRSPEAPTVVQFDQGSARVTCPQGSLIAFQARLFHRSGVNHTQRFRHALTMNGCRAWMKQRMDWVRFVPAAIADKLGPQGRRVLGYDTRLPTSMAEFFLPEAERLYKPNQG